MQHVSTLTKSRRQVLQKYLDKDNFLQTIEYQVMLIPGFECVTKAEIFTRDYAILHNH